MARRRSVDPTVAIPTADEIPTVMVRSGLSAEGDGFELSVPGQRRHPSATANHLFSHHLPPKLG